MSANSVSPKSMILLAMAATVILGCEGASNRATVEDVRGPNGNVTRRKSYLQSGNNGRTLHGTQLRWHENGKLLESVEYKHEKLDGVHERWYDDGTKEWSGHWMDNVRVGLWTWWHSSGEKASECTYAFGRIVGTRTYWLDQRIVREDEHNLRGNLTTIRTYHDNGTEATTEAYVNQRKHGRAIVRNPGGELVAQGEWRNGKPWDGICATPEAGDAGSIGGLVEFGRYENGKLIEKVTRAR